MSETMLTKQKFLENAKVQVAKKKLDLSSDEDLSLGVMNLIIIEEHLFFTAQKTGHAKYLELLREVREIRKATMKQLVPTYEGEVWCVVKHLLASSMRLMEVGTKKLADGKNEEAKQLFDASYDLYCFFWALRLGNGEEILPAGHHAHEPEDEEKKMRILRHMNGAPFRVLSRHNLWSWVRGLWPGDTPHHASHHATLEDKYAVKRQEALKEFVAKLVDCCGE